MEVLEGLRVVEGSAFVAAPLGGMTLAQLGADVIRFDAIGGGIDFHRWPCTDDGTSLFWAGMNKGKRSLAVDVRDPRGREIVTRLITSPGADRGVFLSNFPARGWLADEPLRVLRPDLIYVNIIGNPDSSTAVDYTVNPSSGFAYATGPAGGVLPTNHVLPAWDIATGLTAAVGLLAAERHRARTGIGQHVSVSLADVAFAMVANLGYVAQAQVMKQARPPIGNDMYGAFGRDFPTKDGRRVMLVAISARQWESLVAATEIADHLPAIERALHVDLRLEGDRFVARDALAAFIAPWCAARTLAEIAAVFDSHSVCWGPYQTFGQLVDEDWRCSPANPMFSDIDQPGIGRIRAPGSPLGLGAFARRDPRPAPQLGEHTVQILAEDLGMSAAEIGRLHDDAVVASPAASVGVIADLSVLGVPDTAEALVAAEHVRRVAGTVGDDRDVDDGSELPLLWHWAFFAPTAPVSRLGPDGHPQLDPDGVTAGLPRRMWAGGSVTQHTPLIVGEPATRRSRVSVAERKTGRSGDLLVVSIDHEISQRGEVAVAERQDLIYRPAGDPVAAPQGDTRPVAPEGGWSDPVVADPITLFRFSALTFNSHRIHYDLPYAQSAEGYPALVVHGPLTALLLVGAAERHGHRGDKFEFRATAPLFAGSRFSLVGEPEESGVALRAIRNDGTISMSGRLTPAARR